ncbi:hypothetical protein DAPPUDRAFT_120465 [Daphnia pulex]|uniref:CRAL-TRIO domain-containing protein n=1 Tax=Daphnia pulex TaxID=6669 RepID=E9I1G6_DAPPU|nr:hypothetical protein DAPPUDRAFT_120465 [Daphnia pulex]|eukprot:EFX62164.1 hypothetical protein DAPPUDRAFT_120465 [Daphnia pulex]
MSLTQVRQVQPIVFDQLKIAIKDCTLHDSSDEYLLNWLIVQDFNVARAEKMLRQSLEWRRVNGVDGILQSYTPNEIIKKYFSMGQAGFDKFGSPVFVCCMGRIDFRGLYLSVVKKEYFQFIPWQFENFCLSIKEAREQTGENIEKMTIIMDYEGLAMRQYTCKPGFLFHYPNHLRRVFIINAPKYFPYLFAMVKPFIPQTDIPKIKIFGCDTKQWTSALLEEIDAHQLPAFYGGTLTDPNGDPKCPSKFNMGGEVPSSYYLSNNPPVAKDYMETMSIGAGGRKKMKFKVDVPNSVLRWEFITEGGDIKFRVYSKDSKGNTFDFVPLSRVDSHLDMEEGEITCEEPGKYVLEFDNSFSYLRTKKLRYFIAVDLPSASVEI